MFVHSIPEFLLVGDVAIVIYIYALLRELCFSVFFVFYSFDIYLRTRKHMLSRVPVSGCLRLPSGASDALTQPIRYFKSKCKPLLKTFGKSKSKKIQAAVMNAYHVTVALP